MAKCTKFEQDYARLEKLRNFLLDIGTAKEATDELRTQCSELYDDVQELYNTVNRLDTILWQLNNFNAK